MLDQFMGGCVILGNSNPFGGDREAGDSRRERTMELYKRGKKQDEEIGGHVKIMIGEQTYLLIQSSFFKSYIFTRQNRLMTLWPCE